jgi:hypothetical protein
MTNLDQVIENNILPKLTKETCVILNNNQYSLKKLSWSEGENNKDMPFSNLAKKCCLEAFNKINDIDDLTLEISIPDLKLKFQQKKIKIEKKIELKSTIKTIIPGSARSKFDPNIWTIFCQRGKEKFKLRYGRYFLGMKISDHETFQDRSPRPKLNFEYFQEHTEDPKVEKINEDMNLKFWQQYAKTAINRVINPKNHSWQDDLVKEIIKEVLKNPKKFKDI